jgi:hypothetical protein
MVRAFRAYNDFDRPMTNSGYKGGYPDRGLQDETGVNFNYLLVVRTIQELSYL